MGRLEGCRTGPLEGEEAQMLEMSYVKGKKVYKYANRAEAIRLGHKIISVKWVDTG